MIADYIFQGKSMNHFKQPASGLYGEIDGELVSLDSSMFDREAIQIIANEKIEELKERLTRIEEYHIQNKEILEVLKEWGSNVEVSQILYEYEYQVEKAYINKWVSYWTELFEPKKDLHYSKDLTPEDITNARKHPIDQLYMGQLRHQGGRYYGRCPFHQEKTPSFVIYDNNTFHCFGCQADGDAIQFLRDTRNLNFVDAVRELI